MVWHPKKRQKVVQFLERETGVGVWRGGRMKRTFDILIVLLALIPAWLIGIVLAAMIRMKLGSPILFLQARTVRTGRLVCGKSQLLVGSKNPLVYLVCRREKGRDFGRWACNHAEIQRI